MMGEGVQIQYDLWGIYFKYDVVHLNSTKQSEIIIHYSGEEKHTFSRKNLQNFKKFIYRAVQNNFDILRIMIKMSC